MEGKRIIEEKKNEKNERRRRDKKAGDDKYGRERKKDCYVHPFGTTSTCNLIQVMVIIALPSLISERSSRGRELGLPRISKR